MRRAGSSDSLSFVGSIEARRLPAWATAARLVFWSSWAPLLLPPVLDSYHAADAGSSLWVSIRVGAAAVCALAGLMWAVAEYERRRPLSRSDFFPPIERQEIGQLLWSNAVLLIIAVRGIVSELRRGDADTIWLILFTGSVPFLVLPSVRALWHLRRYDISDRENRLHGR